MVIAQVTCGTLGLNTATVKMRGPDGILRISTGTGTGALLHITFQTAPQGATVSAPHVAQKKESPIVRDHSNLLGLTSGDNTFILLHSSVVSQQGQQTRRTRATDALVRLETDLDYHAPDTCV